MSDEPVILSADMASELARMHLIRPDHAHKPLEAIATGRTVVIRKLTEAQCREAFKAWFHTTYPAMEFSWHGDWIPDMFMGYLACARALGAIVEDGT